MRSWSLVAALLWPWILEQPEPRDAYLQRGTDLVQAPAVQPLTLQKELVSGRELAVPLQMQVIGPHLVLINLRPAQPVELRDTATGRLLRSFGRWGLGDDEFLGVWHIDPVPGAAEAWIWDLTRRRVVLLDVSPSAVRSGSMIRRKVTVGADAALTAPTWAGDTLFSPGFFYTGRLARFSSGGAFAGFVGEAPASSAVDTMPTIVRQQAYQLLIRPNPDRSLFAGAARHAGQLLVLRRDGSIVAHAQVPDAFPPEYGLLRRRGEPTVIFRPDSRYAYIDLATGRKRIYALFSGKKYSETGMHADGRLVHVFDWEGRLLAVYALPAPTAVIAVNPEETKLYGMHAAPRRTLSSYWLPIAP